MNRKTATDGAARNDRELFVEKMQILERAGEHLKKEFVGLDAIIDEIVRQVSCWFVFPEMQEQPCIINLWGMTGVGKTALVSRLVELIGCANSFVRFDLGQSGQWGIHSGYLDKIARFDRKIIALDEFQHARTIDERGVEVKNYGERIIWDLLDSGTVHSFSGGPELFRISEFYAKLTGMIGRGLKARKGKVTAGKKLFVKEFDNFIGYRDRGKSKQEVHLIPDDFLGNFIYNNESSNPNFRLECEAREFFNRLDERQTLAALKDFIDSLQGQNHTTFTNLLIFVMGNLDEAYAAADNFNGEIDADVFYRSSLGITIHQIKEALKSRFRPEQIARLGNNHVIYPSMSRQSFQKLIEIELDRIAQRFFQEKKVRLEFDASLKELIYQEGVVPTQGVRPLISSLNQIVRANLGRIYASAFSTNQAVERILLSVKNRQIVCDYHRASARLFTSEIPVTLFKIRKEPLIPDDKQAVTAVHEAAHAIVGTILTGRLPKEIYSRSSMPGSEGYAFYENNTREVGSFKAFKNEATICLAGLAAEKIFFGGSGATAGASSDIARATAFISDMIQQCGMTREAVRYNMNPELPGVIHDVSESENKAKIYLKKAYRAARRLIRQERRLLLEVANYLSENPSMNGETFNDFLTRFATPEGLENFNNGNLPYRARLHEMLSEARNEATMPEKKLVLIKGRKNSVTAA
ncbi:MAG TPA: hypothetical protein PLM07_05320 [Candidatus Rifleibacterium sp.]|nr:hypothetical protein [Candidatus Rifleibacterium sp.]HPT45301.1 hypothetical protein [Candidatus Rifleibacterium sp.]